MGSSLIGQDKTDISLSAARDGTSGSVQIPQIPLSSNRSSCSSSSPSSNSSSPSSSPSSSSSSSHPPPFSLFSSSSSPPTMHSAASLNVHLNCFPLLQWRIPLCFRFSYSFSAPAVLNSVNEVNGHRMRNGGGRGKELQGTLYSSARFMILPRSEEREVQVQMEEAKKADFRSKLSSEQRKGRQQEEPKAKTKKKEKDEFCTSQIDAFDTRLPQAVTERRRRDR
ncbi:uncharacterized protein MONOS_9481 [Monocercomonoides exilis]|uniref:uncharacterized protein n=1 Tax=Monocercomonoides exilis TaxID=2049356 RepID=UPI003559825A|nr:hypothetical protein MONOS_9481 [Monocercomonoides exilis]|eukprot:MONOS_9481.1-p1 / transcript=MONOS_9481.1 / gene=MONOS_9481 / organism=Monocercomonoides_exilis_PA203 / gene_product=unspecified product / transcript_product=unspecified product / location=Mono_scaffold00393:31725-32396(+) / protein_length=224 / sequence_SO=supercontig / SO=protein_coding / is_pseudo=false